MDRDRDASRRKRVAGSVKELIGKLIGNRETEDEGAREVGRIRHPQPWQLPYTRS